MKDGITLRDSLKEVEDKINILRREKYELMRMIKAEEKVPNILQDTFEGCWILLAGKNVSDFDKLPSEDYNFVKYGAKLMYNFLMKKK